MDFDQADSDFQVLRELHDRIKSDPANAGWYMHCAYMLGQGCTVDEALKFAPKKTPANFLSLIEGGKS
jgi:hypothetical protein